MMRHIYAVLFLLITSSTYCLGNSIKLSENSKISVLTCGAGDEIYSLFGHSAIRVMDPNLHFDLVYNYGMFDFNSKNFIYRFVKGETDYQLGIQDYLSFMIEYQQFERSVFEQTLQLNQAQKQNLFDALQTNYEPEHRVYRYNFFYDNCSSRIRDIISQAMGSQVQFNLNASEGLSHMDMLTPYLANYPWTRLGIRVILGCPIYSDIKDEDMYFLPDYMMDGISQATLISDGKKSPLASKKENLLADKSVPENNSWLSPLFIFSVALILSIWLFTKEYSKGKQYLGYNIILYITTGIVGIFLSWFMLVSVHPDVFPNFNILWLSPLNFAFGIGLFFKKIRNKQYYYLWLMSICSFFFFLISIRGTETSLILLASIIYTRPWGALFIRKFSRPKSNLEQ